MFRPEVGAAPMLGALWQDLGYGEGEVDVLRPLIAIIDTAMAMVSVEEVRCVS